jgi:CRISPR-associated protein Cas2
MPNRTLYLAAYDIANPNRLRMALLVLKAHASGRQKSVFECFLTPKERCQLLEQVASILDREEDRFMLLPLAGVEGIKTLGIGVAPADPNFYYVG